MPPQIKQIPAPPTPPTAPELARVGDAPIAQTTARPSQVLDAARAQRSELRNQMQRLESRRTDLNNSLSDDGLSAASKSGLEVRIKAVDGQIQQMDQQIASADLQVAKAAAVPGAEVVSRPNERGGMDDNMVPITVVFTLFVLFPIALAFARRIWKRTATVVAPIPQDVQNRLEQLGQSVESIALEVERIGEGQRFMTKVMSESGRALGAGAAQPIPVQQADKLGAQQG